MHEKNNNKVALKLEGRKIVDEERKQKDRSFLVCANDMFPAISI